MAIKQLNPYINFNGTAAQAIKLYESALGAKVENIMHYGEGTGMPTGPENKGRILHSLLRIGGGTLMISDVPADRPVPIGGNMNVSLDFDDMADMKAKFEALSAGGKVMMPLQDTFWGATFGMLTDVHGVDWMFNCNKT